MGVFSLAPVLGFALLFARVSASAYSAALLFAVASITLVLYIGGLVGLLWWAALGLHLAGCLVLVHEAWLRGRGNQQLGVSVPIVMLVMCTLIVTAIHGTSLYQYYDEYAHWGVYIREMLTLDAYWTADTNSMHPRYPPAAPLWQYFFNVFREPNEGTTYIAQFVLLATPLMVLFERIDIRRHWSVVTFWIVLILAVCLLVLTDFGLGISSLYVDHVIGAWFIGILLCFVFDSPGPRKALLYILPLTLLSLIKPSSLAFALAAGGIIGASLSYQSWKRDRRMFSSAVVGLSTFAAIAATALLSLQVWEWRLDRIGAPADREAVSGIVSGMSGSADAVSTDQAAEITRRFFEVLVNHQLSNDEISSQFNAFSYDIRNYFTEKYRLTTLGLLVAFALWWFMLLAFVIRPPERRRWALLAAGVLVTAIGFIVSLYLTYRYAIGDKGLALSSFNRYVHTIALGMIIVSFAPLFPAFRQPDSAVKTWKIRGQRLALPSLLAVAGCLALYVFETPYLRPVYQSYSIVPIRQEFEPVVARVHQLADRSSVWVYLPNDQPNGFIGQLLQYMLVPTPAVIERDTEFFDQDRQQVLQAWQQADYIWLASEFDAEIEARISDVFGVPVSGRLFAVNRDDAGRMSFELAR